MRFGRERLFLFLLSLVFFNAYAQSSSQSLTPDQVQVTNDLVTEYKTSCLHKIELNRIPDKFSREMAAWKQEPEVCNCGADRLRAALTVHFLSGNQLDKQGFMWRWLVSDQLRCEIPNVINHYKERCVPLLIETFEDADPKYKGQKKLKKAINNVCGCINTAMANTDIELQIRIALKSYDDTTEAIKTGRPSKPIFDPMQSKLRECFQKHPLD